VRGASVFARHATRIFSILALFALAWAVLTPYYYQADPPELLVGITGFLFAYIGVLLRREAHNPSTLQMQPFKGCEGLVPPRDAFNDSGQAVALWLLPFLVIPSAMPVASSLISALLPRVNFTTGNKIIEPVIPTLLLLVGYYGIYSGIKAYSTSRAGKNLMCTILSVYALTDSAYTVFAVYCNAHSSAAVASSKGLDFFKTEPGNPMNTGFLFAFLFLKLLFTTAFICLVLREGLSDEDRRLPLKYKILKFLKVPFHFSPASEPAPIWIGISREYRGKQEREDIYHERLNLSQGGCQVTGEIDRAVSEWQVEGSFLHDVLVLRYWHENRDRGSGAIVVERVSQTGDFRGCWLGYDRDKKQIGAGPYILTHRRDTDEVEEENKNWLDTPTYFPPAKASAPQVVYSRIEGDPGSQ